MINPMCKKNCASCFAKPTCAVKALIEQDDGIYVDTEKCIGCGSCRKICGTYGFATIKPMRRNG